MAIWTASAPRATSRAARILPRVACVVTVEGAVEPVGSIGDLLRQRSLHRIDGAVGLLDGFDAFPNQLPGWAPAQAPQSVRREDSGEGPDDAERDERPHPEEDSAGVDDPAAHQSASSHVQDEDA